MPDLPALLALAMGVAGSAFGYLLGVESAREKWMDRDAPPGCYRLIVKGPWSFGLKGSETFRWDWVSTTAEMDGPIEMLLRLDYPSYMAAIALAVPNPQDQEAADV